MLKYGYLALMLSALLTYQSAFANTQTTENTSYNPPVLLDLGWQFYAHADYSQALTIFQNTLDVNPNDINALRGQAYSLYKLKQFHLALLQLPKVIKLEQQHTIAPAEDDVPVPGTNSLQPVQYNAQSLMAWSYYYIGQPKTAQHIFYQVLDQYPHWPNALTGLGYTAIARHQRALAQSSFHEATRYFPAYPYAIKGLAEAQYLHYGMTWSTFYSYSDYSEESPYERSYAKTLRFNYAHHKNSTTLQYRHNLVDGIQETVRSSNHNTTLSWSHFFNEQAFKQWGLRIDLHYQNSSNHLYDKTTTPYLSIIYLDKLNELYLDFGYSHTGYKDSNPNNNITIKQGTGTLGMPWLNKKIWASFQAMYQQISNPKRSDANTTKQWSGTGLVKMHLIPKSFDISGHVTLGKRQYTYLPNLFSNHGRLDQQTQGLGLSAQFTAKNNIRTLFDISRDRFKYNAEHYHLTRYSLGLGYAY